MTFCTAINCIDGRVQLHVFQFLQSLTGQIYVDMITEPGPELLLSGDLESETAKSVLGKVDISIREHFSQTLAIVAHHDCAANRVSDAEHKQLVKICIRNLEKIYPQMEIIGLFVDENSEIHEIIETRP